MTDGLNQAVTALGGAALNQAAVQRNAQKVVSRKPARRLAFLLQRDGRTLAAIAAERKAHGYCTRRSKKFRKTTVLRLLERFATLPSTLQVVYLNKGQLHLICRIVLGSLCFT